jgi:hypothetical protein
MCALMAGFFQMSSLMVHRLGHNMQPEGNAEECPDDRAAAPIQALGAAVGVQPSNGRLDVIDQDNRCVRGNGLRYRVGQVDVLHGLTIGAQARLRK